MTEKEFYILVGKNIKRIRESKGLSLFELSTMCIFEKSNLSRLENGRTNVTIKTLFILSKTLGVDVEEFVRVNVS